MSATSRWVGLALVGVTFLAGGVAGIAADRALRPSVAEGGDSRLQQTPDRRGTPRPQGPNRPDPRRVPILEQMELTPEQRERVDSIIERRREEITRLWREHESTYRAAMDSTEREIQEVLTPAQREEYQSRREELRRRWERGGQPRTPNGGREGRAPGPLPHPPLLLF